MGDPSSPPPRLRATNRRNGQIVASEVAVAETLGARTRGLIGKPRLSPSQGLLIRRCRQIHTFFMRYSIDVAFLDGEGRVVRALHALKPWRATAYHPRAVDVLELPEGTLAETDTRKDDLIDM